MSKQSFYKMVSEKVNHEVRSGKVENRDVMNAVVELAGTVELNPEYLMASFDNSLSELSGPELLNALLKPFGLRSVRSVRSNKMSDIESISTHRVPNEIFTANSEKLNITITKLVKALADEEEKNQSEIKQLQSQNELQYKKIEQLTANLASVKNAQNAKDLNLLKSFQYALSREGEEAASEIFDVIMDILKDMDIVVYWKVDDNIPAMFQTLKGENKKNIPCFVQNEKVILKGTLWVNLAKEPFDNE